MKKNLLFVGLALCAFLFSACEPNEPKDKQALIGKKFICYIERGLTPVTEYFTFADAKNYETGMEIYEQGDEARSKVISKQYQTGTYELFDSYAMLYKEVDFYWSNGEVVQSIPKLDTMKVDYKLASDTLTLTYHYEDGSAVVRKYWQAK